MPAMRWAPASRSGSITERIVTTSVVPGAGTRWLAPTRGSEGGGLGCVAVDDVVAACAVVVVGADAGAGDEAVRIVLVVWLPPHAASARPASKRTSARTGFPAHSRTTASVVP